VTTFWSNFVYQLYIENLVNSFWTAWQLFHLIILDLIALNCRKSCHLSYIKTKKRFNYPLLLIAVFCRHNDIQSINLKIAAMKIRSLCPLYNAESKTKRSWCCSCTVSSKSIFHYPPPSLIDCPVVRDYQTKTTDTLYEKKSVTYLNKNDFESKTNGTLYFSVTSTT
jgi:hypothetical protein